MEPFEYVMALVSIVVGLGLTHVLSAFGAAAHRLRGRGEPLKLGATYLLWVGFVLTWLISFWWWEFKFQQINFGWTFGAYLFVILYAIALFLLAVFLVPEKLEGMTDSLDFFLAGRHWFFGALFLANGLDVVDSLMKGTVWGTRPVYIAQVMYFAAVCMIGAWSKDRRVHFLIALTMFAIQLGYTWEELNILGGW